ncbi:YbhB/YbcL family Raf kinase inhibitor-like protein [Thioalkalivibrio paradoxus]|nr:YbhB/YbcL family Raf kinase inhibitor-like protein [Thioalkalivibrio paradoxus]
MPWSATAPNENRLPALEIRDVPEAARSLALILEDLDSPLGGVTHWLVWNLPPGTDRVDALNLPREGRVGMDSFGKVGYLGPVPPEGVHRYRFRLLALDAELDLEAGAPRNLFDQAAAGHVLDEAELTGVIERSPPEAEI